VGPGLARPLPLHRTSGSGNGGQGARVKSEGRPRGRPSAQPEAETPTPSPAERGAPTEESLWALLALETSEGADPDGNDPESGLSINVMYTVDDPEKRAVGFKLSEGMEVPEELASRFKFARQKSKLAGTIRGSYFAFKNDY
jgi:hypothetical protein